MAKWRRRSFRLTLAGGPARIQPSDRCAPRSGGIAMPSVAKMKPREKIPAAEWEMRVDLAACYRLCAAYGMTDLPVAHISARVPGHPDHFLLNPFGLLFDEITASCLVKIDMDGNVVEPSEYEVHRAGHTL